MQMQATERKAFGSDRLVNELLGSVAAEANLLHQPAAHGPVQQGCPLSMQRPGEMARPIQAMHGKVVELAAAEPLEDGLQLSLPIVQGQSRQQLAGDHPAVLRLPAFTLEAVQGMTQKSLRRPIGRCRLEMVDAGLDGSPQHGDHLVL